MRSLVHTVSGLAVLVMVLGGCVGARESAGGAGSLAQQSPKLTKRVTVAIISEPTIIIPDLVKNLPGNEALTALVAAGLNIIDYNGNVVPRLAQEVPTVENGLWTVFPDGRMVTTWKLRPNVVWHDGTSFTGEDLAFTLALGRDPDTPSFSQPAYAAIDRVETPDAGTLVVHWWRLFNEANLLFSITRGATSTPVPKHVLESAYLQDKGKLIDHPYWSDQFVGLGPYKVREFVRGSHLLLDAFDSYFLGRPKVDVIEVKFIPDHQALVASLLAGTVDATLGRGLSVDEAATIRDQWRDGRLEISNTNLVRIYPQFVNPNPPIVANVQFRRALMYAMDRQEIVDTVHKGLVGVGHSFLSPSDPFYKETEAAVVKYDYDPRRAVELIQSLGYTRDSEGLFRDAAGQRLSLELRVGEGRDVPNQLAVAQYWRQVGVQAEPFVSPRQLAADNEYRATFPAFELQQHPSRQNYLLEFHSREAPLPENNFRGTGNRPRYMSAEFDALLERFQVAIARAERLDMLKRILGHISENLVLMGVHYAAEPGLIHNRLANVRDKGNPESTPVWNVHEWDVK